MDILGIPLFRLADDRMSYLATRHALIAENVANANTPNYVGRDLKPFEAVLADANARMAKTSAGHMDVGTTGSRLRTDPKGKSWEIVPSGNTVSIEQEMLKATDTVMSYALVSNVYKSNVKLLSLSLSGPR